MKAATSFTIAKRSSISRLLGSGVRTRVVGVNRDAKRNEVNHE